MPIDSQPVPGAVIGKELIVQVTDTTGDLGDDCVDLQILSGGVELFDGCR